MRILPKSISNSISIFVLFLSFSTFSQEGKTKINQDPRFEQLLAEKRKINSSITIDDHFKIQIYTGDAATCKKELLAYKKANRMDATIVFHTPIYKVWVGSFKTRIEAEKKLLELRKKYPNAFILRPNK